MAVSLRSCHASSSMANSTQPCFIYDVFLSFHGDDTRKTFTDHLYNALKKGGVKTFRDDAMERGKLLQRELKKAIQKSAISLIVFSKNYASSNWCLDEVLMIMEEHENSSSKHEVVPVFYNVDPTDVRNQTGCFGEAFNKKETDLQKQNASSEKVKAWRASLKRAGSLAGMVSKDGFEAEIIINIVKDIRKKLNYNDLYIKGKLVGMKNDVAKIESWLQDHHSPNSTVLLIHGMGGIGKTTLAKCIFNSNCREYDGSCFLANINEELNQPMGLLRLQTQLLSKILKSEEKMIWNVDEGTDKVMKAICSQKILLVLDDVTTSEQLDVLLGPKTFHRGSKVIITSRGESLSNKFDVRPRVQEIRKLSSQGSSELFSLYAFHQTQPTEPYIVLSKLAIDYCMDLPLALFVLGSYLCGRDIKEWEETMRRLESIPLPGIQKVLKLSYESLEEDHDKDLFLHIACFFVGEDEDFIVKILSACNLYPFTGIKNLMDRCLVYVKKGKVWMHQLIREMGQEVVRLESQKDPGKRSRLWRHEDCINVLLEDKGTGKVEGLMLDMQKTREAKSTSTVAIKMDDQRKHSSEEYSSNTVCGNEATFNIRSLERMMNLMLLQLNYVTLSGECKNLPKNLRLLRWHGFPLKSIPADIFLEKLVVLDMCYSKLECVWKKVKVINSLKILNLSYSVELTKTPDFDGLRGLENLILKGCVSLIEVDESIAKLEGLILLDITDCRSLRNFPCLPTSLVSLEMSGCPNLGVIGGFKCLDSVSLASHLVCLNISNCSLSDKSFPNDWSGLESLETLIIDGNKVTSLPDCIHSLPKVVFLRADNCSQIRSILGLPKTIESLVIYNNESLEKVQLPQNSTAQINSYGCLKLCDVEGVYKWQSIDKVDYKILQILGLGSPIACERIELGTLDYSKVKVVHEYGIFSTWVTEKQIPLDFKYKEIGPQISFTVSLLHNNSRKIIGFNLCQVCSLLNIAVHRAIAEVYNKTKDLLWMYFSGILTKPSNTEKVGWLSFWRCGNLLDNGDEIFVRILNRYTRELYTGVEECRINLVYGDIEDINVEEYDEELERKEANNQMVVSALDQIAWSDRMFTEISDCVHYGKTYSFGEDRTMDYNTGFYSGYCGNVKEVKRPIQKPDVSARD